MKINFSGERYRYYILGFLTLGFFITTAIFSYNTKDTNELFFSIEDGVYIDFNEGWIDEDGNTVNIADLTYHGHKDRESYLFYRTIPEGLTGEESLSFEVKHMGFCIYFDDREYDGYDYGETPDSLDFVTDDLDARYVTTDFEKMIMQHYTDYYKLYGVDYIAYMADGLGSGLGSRGAGTYLRTMQLYTSDVGDTIYLELFPVYSNSKISNMAIEPASAYIRSRIMAALPSFIVCIVIILIGVAIIIVTKLISDQRSGRIYESLAALIILVGLWSMIETHLLDYVLGTSEYLHTISYFLLMSMAYPIAVFSDMVTLKPHKRIAGIVFWATVILIDYCTFTNYTEIFDFHETVYLSDLLIMVTGFFVIIRIIMDQKFRKDNDLHVNTNWIDLSLAFITFMGLIDLLRYINILHIKKIFDSSFFTRIGVLVFTIGMFINLFIDAMNRNRQADKAGAYMEMAFTDALTGIPNRGAFLLKESEISDRMREVSKRKKDVNFQIVYVALDLNGLKIVNDTLGHATGDDYIVAASGILMQAFSDYGYVYRVGGDEFASFIVCDNAVDRYLECIDKMREMIRDYNEKSGKDMQMHIAYGYSVWTPGDHRDIGKVEKDGDEAMYEKKRQMKKVAAAKKKS